MILVVHDPLPCFAGHYSSPVYSSTSGEATWTTDEDGGSESYYLFYDGSFGGSAETPASNSGTASCSGAITATFTWVPDFVGDEPPNQVIIKETSSAYWEGWTSFTAPVGTVDNGLGFPDNSWSGYNSDMGQWEGTGSSDGTKYSVVSGGTTVTVTCSPSADASGSFGNVGVWVNYKAELLIPTVVLSGGTNADPNKFLIGQRVTASLSSTLSVTSYDWHVSGGSPFSDYNPSNTSAHLTPLGSETGSSLYFCFAKDASATVACTVHLSVPSGSKPTGGLDLSVFRYCTVEKPTFTSRVSTGTVYFMGSPQSMFIAHGATETSADNPADTGTAGCMWAAKVIYPAGYTTDPHEFGWNFTQLVTTSRSRVNNGSIQNVSLNGQTVLDSTFGYSADFETGVEHVNGDSPSEGVASSLSSVSVNDNFKTYIMFKPVGTGSRYVPLKYWTWYWKAEARKDAGTGVWSFVAGSNTAGSAAGGSLPNHPEWTANITSRVWQ